jgi:PTS system nitrogen regulatory IIA component
MKLPMQRVADGLGLPESTLRRWIRQGRIPVQRSGVDAIFSHRALEKWATTHNLTFSLDSAPVDDRQPDPVDTLVAAMQRGTVCHRITGKDAAQALKSAVDCIDLLSEKIQEELFEKLIERERLASTGIGNGIAIPHPRDPLSQPPPAPVIITCFPENPLDFNAIDDQPVFVFFVLLSPTVQQHLHLLSRLSYCIRDRAFRSFLNPHPDAKALFARVARCEQQLDSL